MDFWRFRAAKHILRANCTKINWDRHRKAAYEIFSIERRFRWSTSRFSRFKETCAREHQRAVPTQKVVITRESKYCFQRVLAIAILSVHLSVCPSVCHTGGSVKKRCKRGSPNRLPGRL